MIADGPLPINEPGVEIGIRDLKIIARRGLIGVHPR
jgi:hypothetical protein